MEPHNLEGIQLEAESTDREARYPIFDTSRLLMLTNLSNALVLMNNG